MANTGIEQKIIGAWVDNDENRDTWTFEANGSLTIKTKNDESYNFKYGATDRQLAYAVENYSPTLYNMSISTDGKTMILSASAEGGALSGYWLTKK